MKNKILRLTSIAFIGLGLAATSAAQGIDIDSIASAGTGCAPGTVSKHAELLPDGSLKLDIEFSEYNVLVGYGQTLDRKNCGLAIPISLGPNQKLKVQRLILRADGILSASSKTAFRTEVFTPGTIGPVIAREIVPDRDLQGRFTLRASQILETECGAETSLRVNSSILINSQGTTSESGLSAASMTLVLTAEQCN